MSRAGWTVILLAVLGLFATSAGAEDRQKAREAYSRATQHYDLGEFSAALDEFKDAYRNYEEPSFLFNIAQCYRQLDKKQDAIVFYRSYLRKAPNAANRDEVASMIRRLETDLEAEKSKPTVGQPIPPSPPVGSQTAISPLVATKPAASSRVPVYKKWYLWTAIGGVALVGVAVGLGVGLSRGSLSAPTDFGTVQPTFR